MSYSPTKIILLFFLAVIVLGTLLLSLPFARQSGHGFSMMANFFTATSAVCVTGLNVVDIGSYYSVGGQIIILLLIQIGGLGYMTLSTLVGVFLGKLSLKERAVIKELLDVNSFSGLLTLLKKIFLIVILFETAGAVLLSAMFLKNYPVLNAVYYGIFHSVSAFCNAGFSLFSTGLEQYVSSAPVQLVFAALIILGGLGFLVLVELGSLLRNRKKKLTVHTRIVLSMTGILLLLGTALFFFFEHGNTLKGYPFGYKLMNSFFQSTATRTAGFNTIPIGACLPQTLVMLMGFMFIGASPGGTGGGIKTSTFAIVAAFLYSMLKQRSIINIFSRQISGETVNKALAILLLSVAVIGVSSVFIISLEASHSAMSEVFETVSAFGTVGLSTGITPQLSDISKLAVMATMLVGRVGPLTFLLAIIRKGVESSKIKYPEEKVLIG